MKNKTIALILSVLLGGLGIDRFYLGYTGMGILKLLTGGCLGILWIIDIVFIAMGKLQPADGSPYEEDVAKQNNSMGANSNQDPFWGYSTTPARGGMPQIQNAVRCQKCGEMLSPGSVFCGKCGAKSEPPAKRICSYCGRILEGEDQFCPGCGQRYVDPKKRCCKVCGATIEAGSIFCGSCGTKYTD